MQKKLFKWPSFKGQYNNLKLRLLCWLFLPAGFKRRMEEWWKGRGNWRTFPLQYSHAHQWVSRNVLIRNFAGEYLVHNHPKGKYITHLDFHTFHKCFAIATGRCKMALVEPMNFHYTLHQNMCSYTLFLGWLDFLSCELNLALQMLLFFLNITQQRIFHYAWVIAIQPKCSRSPRYKVWHHYFENFSVLFVRANSHIDRELWLSIHFQEEVRSVVYPISTCAGTN